MMAQLWAPVTRMHEFESDAHYDAQRGQWSLYVVAAVGTLFLALCVHLVFQARGDQVDMAIHMG